MAPPPIPYLLPCRLGAVLLELTPLQAVTLADPFGAAPAPTTSPTPLRGGYNRAGLAPDAHRGEVKAHK